MMKVVCTGYEKEAELSSSEEDKHHKPYHSFVAAFDYTMYSEASRLEEKLKTISAIENADDPNNENTLLEDMFITLQDPLGCAYDLVDIIFYNIELLSAMVESLASSVHYVDLYKYKLGLMEYGDIQSQEITEEEAEEIKYIFTTALTTYKFVYNNPELKEDYTRKKGKWYLNHGISHEKLDLILAISDRRRLRNLINGFRDDLGNLMKSEYYKNAISICSVHQPNPLAAIEGKNIISDHLLCLAHYPAMVDQKLLANHEYNFKGDTWIKEIINTSYAKSIFSHIDALLFEGINLTPLEVQDTTDWQYVFKFNKKLFSHFQKMGKTYVGMHDAIEMKLFKNQLNFTTRMVDGERQHYLVIDEKTLIKEHYETFERVKENIASKHPMHSSNKSFKHSARGPLPHTTYWLLVEEQFRKETDALSQAKFSKNTKKLSVHIKNSHKLPYAKKIDRFVNGTEFRGAVLVFEIFSLVNHADKMLANRKNIANADYIKLAGVVTKATSAGLNLAESISKDIAKDKVRTFISTHPRANPTEVNEIRKTIKKSSFATKGSGVIRFAGKAASTFTLYFAVEDMHKALARSDNDAALAYSGAAALAAVSLAGSLGWISLAGLPGLIVAGLGLAFYGLAYYLTDDELETFFKFFPFSSQTRLLNNGNENPYYNARLMYKGKETLIGNYQNDYMPANFNESYKSVYVRLMNLIVGSNIKLEAGRVQRSYRSPKATAPMLQSSDKNALPKNWMEENDEYWANLSIDISFGSFLSDAADLEYELYLIQHDDPYGGNRSYRLPKGCWDTFITAPTTTANKKVAFKEPSFRAGNINANYHQFHIWLRVPKYIENTATPSFLETNKQYINKHSSIAILCRYTNSQIKLPITSNDQQGYLFNSLPVRKTQEKEKKFANLSNLKSGKAQIVTDKSLFFKKFPLQN